MTDKEAVNHVLSIIQGKIHAEARQAWAHKVHLARYCNAGDDYTSDRVQDVQGKLRTANAAATRLHDAIHVIQQL